MVNGSLLAELERFLLELEKKGASKHTLKSYRYYLSRFIQQANVKQPQEITQEVITLFRKSLKDYKKTSRNYFLIALRQFLKFLKTNLDPDQIKLDKLPRQRPQVLNNETLTKLLSLPDYKSDEGLRDRAILSLICSTGLKVSEMAELNRTDVDIAACKLRTSPSARTMRPAVLVKRGLFLNEGSREALRRYLAKRSDDLNALFIRYRGEPGRLSDRSIERMIEKYAKKIGLKGKITPQILRHSFAAAMIKEGESLKSLQKILGHAYLGSTQVYSNLKDQ